MVDKKLMELIKEKDVLKELISDLDSSSKSVYNQAVELNMPISNIEEMIKKCITGEKMKLYVRGYSNGLDNKALSFLSTLDDENIMNSFIDIYLTFGKDSEMYNFIYTIKDRESLVLYIENCLYFSNEVLVSLIDDKEKLAKYIILSKANIVKPETMLDKFTREEEAKLYVKACKLQFSEKNIERFFSLKDYMKQEQFIRAVEYGIPDDFLCDLLTLNNHWEYRTYIAFYNCLRYDTNKNKQYYLHQLIGLNDQHSMRAYVYAYKNIKPDDRCILLSRVIELSKIESIHSRFYDINTSYLIRKFVYAYSIGVDIPELLEFGKTNVDIEEYLDNYLKDNRRNLKRLMRVNDRKVVI